MLMKKHFRYGNAQNKLNIVLVQHDQLLETQLEKKTRHFARDASLNVCVLATEIL